MPQIAKGGKWVFGWVVVGWNCDIRIPPEAYREYGFQSGETVIIIRGSLRSGGIGIGKVEKLASTPLQSRFIGQSRIEAGEQVTLPATAGIVPGERLLVVRGSGLALSFLKHGPICEEALKHPEIEVFNASLEG